MSKVLIIDDSDPAIIYSGNWILGTIVAAINTNEYNSTVHQSATAGDQLKYTFYGTGCSVYGTLDSPQFHGPPSATFSIDGGTPTALNTTGKVDQPNIVTSHVLLYQSPSLEKTTHTITIKTGAPPTPAAALYIDFLTVSTGSDSASGNIIVDNRDQAIVYDGPWVSAGAQSEYLGSTSQAPPAANGGSATFHFNGTSITVFGTTKVTSGPGTTAILGVNVDGASVGLFTGPQNSDVIKHTSFFHTTGLSNTKEHTIVLTTLSANLWYLDYIVYTTENSASNSNASAQTLGGTGSLNVGAIAGGVVAGAVALLAVLGIICMVIRRRRTKAAKEAGHDTTQVPAMGPSGPFNGPSASTNMQSYGAPNYYPPPHNGASGSPFSIGGTGDGSAMPLLNPEPSSSHIGAASSAYSSHPSGSQYTEPSGPTGSQQTPNTPPSGAFSGLGTHNPPYPRFGAGVGRVEAPVPSHQANATDDELASIEKARFTLHNPPLAATVRNIHRPLSADSVVVEEDSGIRIPRTSPPVYTPD